MDHTCTAAPVASAAELRARVERMRADAAAVAAGIAAGVLGEVADAALPPLVVDLLAAADAATAAATVSVGRAHSSGALRAEGFVSTKGWLQHVARCSGHDATTLVARCRDLDRPQLAPTRVAWLTGSITGAHVRAIAFGLAGCERKATTDQLRAVVLGACQDLLVDLATDHSPEEVTAAASRMLHALFPDGVDSDQQDAYDAQHLTLSTVGQQTVIRAVLDLEGGVALGMVLDRIIDGWFRDGTLSSVPVIDPATRQVDQGATTAAAGTLQRTRREHYRALALAHVAEQWLTRGDAGTAHGIHPHLTLTANLADVVAGTGSGELAVPGSEVPAVVPISVVTRLACDADIALLLTRTTSDGGALVPVDGDVLSALARDLRARTREILWLGREHRHVTARLWRLLVARDARCRFPGCHAPAARCHPHHVVPWWQGGETDPSNLILLCHKHHRMVHEGRWTIAARADASPLCSDYWDIQPPPRRDRR